jgi:hypothetical protein
MLRDGELESFMDGGSRLITVASIRAHVAKGLAGAASATVPIGRGAIRPKQRPRDGRRGL